MISITDLTTKALAGVTFLVWFSYLQPWKTGAKTITAEKR
jgi:hypothetical protein